MEQIAQALREAYKLIQEADTTDIDAFYLSVEQAQGFIAEALDLVDNHTSPQQVAQDTRQGGLIK